MLRRFRPQARAGYVLFAVLIVVVVLSLVAYQYSDAMATEYRAAVRATDAAQARLSAVSGVHYAAGIAADPNAGAYNLSDAADLFSNQPVGDQSGPGGGWRFSLIHIANTGAGTYERRYGLTDETAKLNVNMLIQLDPQGNTLHDLLMKLPDMTEEIADAIVDWVDADSTARPAGCESDHYTGLDPAYRCKNGPINSLEELLLVRGVTADLLFGTDRNRNGVEDANEATGAAFGRGWSEYLTCYGREVNVDAAGVQRINLNGTDAKALSEQLTAAVGQELSDYILYYRLSGRGEAYQATLPANKVAAAVGDLRALVQAQIDAGATPSRRLTSTLTIVNTQIQLPAPPAEPGMPTPPTPVVACPVNDAEALKGVLAVLLDKCTASDDYEMTPRINVFNAPREVLMCLTGLTASPALTEADVDAILAARPTSATDQTAAWLVTAGNLSPTKFKNIEKYVGGRSGAYRVHSVGYSGANTGPVARVEAVIEVVNGMPRIAYFRDLTDLGRGFDDLPR